MKAVDVAHTLALDVLVLLAHVYSLKFMYVINVRCAFRTPTRLDTVDEKNTADICYTCFKTLVVSVLSKLNAPLTARATDMHRTQYQTSTVINNTNALKYD